MLSTKAAVAMACCERDSYALENVSKLLIPAEIQELFHVSESVMISGLPVMMIEFADEMPQEKCKTFCIPWSEGTYSQVTPGVVSKLVRFDGSLKVLYYACQLYVNLVRVIISDNNLH